MHIKLVFATYKVRVKKGKRQARSKMMFDQKKKKFLASARMQLNASFQVRSACDSCAELINRELERVLKRVEFPDNAT